MSEFRSVLGLPEEGPEHKEEAKQLKARFLEALKCNNAAEVAKILRTTSIDIDTVFDVEDRNMTLASYKQGNYRWDNTRASYKTTPTLWCSQCG